MKEGKMDWEEMVREEDIGKRRKEEEEEYSIRYSI